MARTRKEDVDTTASENVETLTGATGQTEQVQPKAKSVYPVYDLMKIEVENMGPINGEKTVTYGFTTIKRMRSNVKVEKHVADERNRQSHNSKRRLYPAGKAIGETETITLKL